MDNPTTQTTRAQLAAYLDAATADTVTVIPHPTVPDDPDDRITAVVIIIRDRIDPATVPGHYIETHQVWVLDPHVDREISENALDSTTDDVLGALADPAAPWVRFESAERDTFADKYPAYRLTVTIASTQTEEE